MTGYGAWRGACVRFAAESPVHIGWHDLGTVQRTRYYIPARNLWAVLVSRLAPMVAHGYAPPQLYTEARKKLAHAIRSTCLFPRVVVDAHGSRKAEPVWRLPQFRASGFRLASPESSDEGWEAAEFEYRFVRSQTSTALIPSSLAAEDGALHESEYLAPVGREGEALFFEGYVFYREGLEKGVDQSLQECWMGADRRYGWGRLRRVGDLARLRENDTLFGWFQVENWEEDSGPVLKPASSEWYLAGHAPVAGSDLQFAGDVEALSGRDWTSKGSGRRVVQAELCWVPGCRPFKADGGGFRIAEEGSWCWGGPK